MAKIDVNKARDMVSTAMGGDYQPEATLRLEVKHFSKTKIDGSHLSPICMIRGLPWKILAMCRQATPRSPKTLGFFLQCNVDSDLQSWSCNAQFALKMLPQKEGVANYERQISHIFSSKENDWGFSNFMQWNRVIDPGYGYIKDDTITLEVHVRADEPKGIELAPQTAAPFGEQSKYRNLALKVEGRTFWLPKDTLASYSSVFEAMLYGEFAEAKENVVRLTDKKTKDVEELLLCLIPHPTIKPINDRNVDLILSFADEYQIEQLRREGEKFLSAKLSQIMHGDRNSLIIVIRITFKHRFYDLLQQAIKRCADEVEVDSLREDLDDLAPEVFAGLMVYVASKSMSASSNASASTKFVCCGNRRGQRCYGGHMPTIGKERKPVPMESFDKKVLALLKRQ